MVLVWADMMECTKAVQMVDWLDSWLAEKLVELVQLMVGSMVVWKEVRLAATMDFSMAA